MFKFLITKAVLNTVAGVHNHYLLLHFAYDIFCSKFIKFFLWKNTYFAKFNFKMCTHKMLSK